MPVLAIPAAGAAIVALVAILIVLGAPGFKHLFDATVGRLPIVGGYIAGAMNVALDAATSQLRQWADSAMRPINTVLSVITVIPWWIASAATTTGYLMVEAIIRVNHRALAGIAGAVAYGHQVLHFLAGEISALHDDVFHAINAAWALTQLGLSNLHDDVFHAINAGLATMGLTVKAVEAEAAAEVSALHDDVFHAINAGLATMGLRVGAVESEALQGIQNLAGQTAHDIAGAVSVAEAAIAPIATSVADAATRALGDAVHDVVIGPWDVLLPELEAIIGALDPAIVGALGLEGVLPRDLPVTIPGILALLVPAIAAIGAETARCGVPICRDLSGLQKLLHTITGDAFLAALLAWLVLAATNPQEAVTDATDTMGAIVDDTFRAFRGLLGV